MVYTVQNKFKTNLQMNDEQNLYLFIVLIHWSGPQITRRLLVVVPLLRLLSTELSFLRYKVVVFPVFSQCYRCLVFPSNPLRSQVNNRKNNNDLCKMVSEGRNFHLKKVRIVSTFNIISFVYLPRYSFYMHS